VGESEKRIAEAFDQAEEDGAILLLDEADSFLRDRSRSSHSWEVSTVNELLQRMERFEEIFICTTNLFKQVDIAALRRFTFKLEFLPLTLEQRWAMFLNETGLRGKAMTEKRQSTYEERLAFMKDLTPGDFATVKRQCLLMGEDLSPEAWLDQLEIEVAAKHRSAADDGQSQAVS
jgi:SpoVK/Ycf46/Vps4 family AAA+-type ATPase